MDQSDPQFASTTAREDVSEEVSNDASLWSAAKAPSLDEMDAIAARAFARLPDHFRALCADVIIRIDDFPSDDVLQDMRCESEFDLLGLFQGVGLPFQSVSEPQPMPNMVWLYRRPILDYWAEHDETLGAIISHVLVHEIGHHFGLSDDDIDAIEAAVE